MKKALYIIVLSIFSLSGYAQWNTDRILTIGRNALYFEDYVLSIQYFNQVIKIKPYLAEPYMYRAMAKIQLGDDKGAELDANEAIERNPFIPQAYYIRGFARRRLGLYADAASDFSKALEFSPASFNLLMNRMDAQCRIWSRCSFQLVATDAAWGKWRVMRLVQLGVRRHWLALS